MVKVVIWALIVSLTIPLMVSELIYSVRNPLAQYWYRLAFVLPIVVPWVNFTLLVWRFI